MFILNLYILTVLHEPFHRAAQPLLARLGGGPSATALPAPSYGPLARWLERPADMFYVGWIPRQVHIFSVLDIL